MATSIIFPCIKCNKEVIDDAIQCDLCNHWIHRSCAKITRKDLIKKSSQNQYYFCFSCTEVFPFHDLSYDEFVYENSCFDVSEDIFQVYSKVNLTFNCIDQTEFTQGDWETYVDPDTNFFSNALCPCKYYTSSAVKAKIDSIQDLSIIHLNARSLKTNFGSIKCFLKELNVYFHVIAISETWLDNDCDLQEYSLPGYDMFNSFRNNKRGGGVALYINNNLTVKKLSNFTNVIDDIMECVTVEIINKNGRNIIVCCIYRSPGTNIELFNDYIEGKLKQVKNKPLYLCGDLNIDLLKTENHVLTKNFLDILYTFGLFPTINKPTRITSVSATIIDNIFTNVKNVNGLSGIIINDITDHLPVFSVLETKGISLSYAKKYQFIRKYDEAKMVSFKEELTNCDWDSVVSGTDVNCAYSNFINEIKLMHEKYFPLTKVCVNSKHDNKPWLTNGIINAIKKKNVMYRRFIKDRSSELECKYKRYKNKLTSIIRQSEKMYYSNLLEANKSSIKNTWNILNKVLRKDKTSDNLPKVMIDNNGTCASGEASIANAFNNYFVNVGPSLANKIPEHKNISIFDFMNDKIYQSMFLLPTDETELFDIVNSCSGKSSMDSDEMSMKFIKNIFSCIVKPFERICNLSFVTGVFPDKLKVAKIIPLFKAGDKKSFNNYRPVSLLPQFSKLLEKLFDKRLQKFIDKCDILTDSQYGFRSNRSTSLALIELLEEICTAIDNKKITVGVFIDLKKAFDTLDHELLLKKLEHYGVRGVALKWLTSYLYKRKQFVQIGNTCSDLRDITCGVPQGSVLGPKLFIMYINDICNVSDIIKFILFADDTNLFKCGDNVEELCTQLSNELSKLLIWFDINKLSLNILKTNFMIFGRVSINSNPVITINDTDIEHVSSTKFLGVLIDEKLSWSLHIDKVKRKLSKCTAVLYRVNNLLDTTALFTLYNSLFLPYLTYCCIVWGNTFTTRLQPLILSQKRAIRIVFKVSKFTHSTKLFYDSFSLKFLDIVKINSLSLMFKAYHKMLPINLQKWFEVGSRTKQHVTRQKNKFSINYVRTSLKSHCISSIGPKLWNLLPFSVSSCNNLYKFKNKYKNYLLSYYNEQVN